MGWPVSGSRQPQPQPPQPPPKPAVPPAPAETTTLPLSTPAVVMPPLPPGVEAPSVKSTLIKEPSSNKKKKTKKPLGLQTLQFSNKPRLRRRHSSSIIQEVIDDSSSQVTALLSNVKTEAQQKSCHQRLMCWENGSTDDDDDANNNNNDEHDDQQQYIEIPSSQQASTMTVDQVLLPCSPQSPLDSDAPSPPKGKRFWRLRKSTMTATTTIATPPTTASATERTKNPIQEDQESSPKPPTAAVIPPHLLLVDTTTKPGRKVKPNTTTKKKNRRNSNNTGEKRQVAITTLAKPEPRQRRKQQPSQQPSRRARPTSDTKPNANKTMYIKLGDQSFDGPEEEEEDLATSDNVKDEMKKMENLDTTNNPALDDDRDSKDKEEKNKEHCPTPKPLAVVSALSLLHGAMDDNDDDNNDGKKKNITYQHKMTPRKTFRSLVDEHIVLEDDEEEEEDDDFIWGVIPRAASTSESDDSPQAPAATATPLKDPTFLKSGLPPVPPKSPEPDPQQLAKKHLEVAIGSWNRNIMSYLQDLPLAALLNVSNMGEAAAGATTSGAEEASSSSVSSPHLSDTTSGSSSAHVVLVGSGGGKPKRGKGGIPEKLVLPSFKQLRQPSQQQQQKRDNRKKKNKGGGKKGGAKVPSELNLAKLWKSQPSIPREVEIRTKPSLESTTSHQTLITAATSGSTTSSTGPHQNHARSPKLATYSDDDDDDDEEEQAQQEEGDDELNVLLTFRRRQEQQLNDQEEQQQQQQDHLPATKGKVVSLTTFLSKKQSAAAAKKATTTGTTNTAIETSCSNLTKTTATTSSSTASCSTQNQGKSWLQEWRRTAKYNWDNKDWLRVVNLPKTIVVDHASNGIDSPTAAAATATAKAVTLAPVTSATLKIGRKMLPITGRVQV